MYVFIYVSNINCRYPYVLHKRKLLYYCFSKKLREHAWNCMQGCIMQKTDIGPSGLSSGSCLHAREPHDLHACSPIPPPNSSLLSLPFFGIHIKTKKKKHTNECGANLKPKWKNGGMHASFRLFKTEANNSVLHSSIMQTGWMCLFKFKVFITI